MPDPGIADQPGGDRRELLRRQLISQLRTAPAGSAVPDPAPTLTVDPARQHEPFPLTPLQEAYWVGRGDGQRLGGTACHGYLELDAADLEPDRLRAACDRLIRRHPMLRAVIDADGRQRVLAQVPDFALPVIDATGPDGPTVLTRVRDEMSHQVLPADRWPLFDIRLSRTGPAPGTGWRLHISFDILIADALSFRILATELADLYDGRDARLPDLGLTFRDYVQHLAAQQDSGDRDTAWQYWRHRIADLPPAPELPLRADAEAITAGRFTRFEARIPAETWSALRKRAGEAGVAPAATVLAAFAETLGMWSASPRFTVNLTLFDRRPVHPDVNQVVGPFTDINLLGVRLDTVGTFAELAGGLQRQMWQDLEHRAVSGVEVLRELHRQGRPAAMPVVFTYVQDPGNDDFRADLSRLGTVRYALSQTPQVLIDCQVSESDGAGWLWWDAVAEAFPDGLLAEMFDAFADLVRRLADADTWAVGAPVPVPAAVPAARRATETTAALPLRPLHQLVAEAGAARPAAVAVRDPAAELTYQQLGSAVVDLAARLRAAGLTPGELVAVHAPDGIDRVIGVLGVCAAGGAYLPLETTAPPARRAELVDLGGARLLVAAFGPDGVPPDWSAGLGQVLPIRRPGPPDAGPDPSPTDTAGPAEAALRRTAYVIFTSGSTGTPKGVELAHGPAANTILDINQRYGITDQDRVFAVSSIGFDLSVWDVFGTLAAGATVISADPGEAGKDPARWLDRMRDEQVTVWNSAPALMALLVDLCELRATQLPQLRLVLLSGDWIPLDLPGRIRRIAPQARVVSLGGATEAAIWSVAYDTDAPDRGWTSVPYGFPLTNQQLYVLDHAGRERPFGVPGELHIGGVGLAQGYWRQPELTAAAFVDHPGHGRLYRTGDLARRHPDGCLEFLGRRDGQVKIQGHRVELGEVEAALTGLPEVRAAAAAAVGPRDRQRQLVAYVVPADGPVDPGELRGRLAAILPSYLVPSRLTVVDQLPLTPNGKLDRKRLDLIAADPAPSTARAASPADADVSALTVSPAGSGASPTGSGASSPAGSVASPFRDYLLARVRDWLDDPQVQADDDLVLAGLDSIDLVRLANLLERELDFRPSREDLVRTPTVAAVHRMLEQDLFDRLRAGARIRTDGAGGDAAPSGADPQADQRAAARRLTLYGLPGTRLPGAASPAAVAPPGTVRRFAPEPVTAEQLAELLAVLRAVGGGDAPRYRYASAGGTYAVRTFVHIASDTVAGFVPGLYFYHPQEHHLAVFSRLPFAPTWFNDYNRPVAETAAFAVHLAVDAAAIAARYGPDAVRYANLEAGAMAQLLRQAAPDCGLGLCQIGDFDVAPLTGALGLPDRRDLLACLLGGPPAPTGSDPTAGVAATDDRATGDSGAAGDGAAGQFEEGYV